MPTTQFDIAQLEKSLDGIDLRTLVKIPAILELINEHITEFTINLLPAEIRNREYSEAYQWNIRVIRKSPGMYAVQGRLGQYTKGMVVGYEGLPSSRTDRFIKSHRFPLEQALDLAYKAAAKEKVMGMTAYDYVFWCEASDLYDIEKEKNPDLDASNSRTWINAKYKELKEAAH